MLKELVFTNDENITIQHNGLVIKEYDFELGWYRFKIIADVAVVTAVVSYDGYDYDGGPVVYGGVTDDDGGTHIWCNINELVGFTDKAIRIEVVNENYRLPEGEIIFCSPVIDGDFFSWALVMYGGQAGPVLYVHYNNFDESSYNEVVSILSKLYLPPESDE